MPWFFSKSSRYRPQSQSPANTPPKTSAPSQSRSQPKSLSKPKPAPKSRPKYSTLIKPHSLPWWDIPPFEWGDPYHWLITLSWPVFISFMGLIYLGTNLFFACLYMLQPNSIQGAEHNFLNAFFFSIQTLASIGYGAFTPNTLYAHFLVAIQAWTSLLIFALVTGLMFARFSLPTARVLFSNVAVICPFNGVPTLMFRVANQRSNRILEAQVRVSLFQREITEEKHFMYRFYDLNLLRSETPSFGLTWMVMHEIIPGSHLYDKTLEELEQQETQIFVTLTGLDETLSQVIHEYHIYEVQDLRWNMRFVDILFTDDRGYRYINYEHFHTVEPEPNLTPRPRYSIFP